MGKKQEQNETVTDIPLAKIRDFPDHPYQVRDDESMNELVESIKERGLIQPVLVRPVDGGYEMVSGHRRKRAFELAGIETIPARIKQLSRDEAILAMVDSNLQREQILPSEKAKAYKMRLDAMKRQGKRIDITSDPVGPKLSGSRSNAELASQVNESESQIKRYIRLNELVPEILNLVDDGQIAMRPAVEISYLPEESQKQLFDFDAWASTFGETVTAIELAPEGTGYRSKTRFAKFYNLPELMMMFRQVADYDETIYCSIESKSSKS